MTTDKVCFRRMCKKNSKKNNIIFFLSPCCCVFDRYDGESSENSTENSVDKSKLWNRSIEDLHGGNNLSSAVTGNSFSRASRHSTIRCEHTNRCFYYSRIIANKMLIVSNNSNLNAIWFVRLQRVCMDSM